MLRVLVTDSRPLMRLGLRHALDGAADLTVAGEAGTVAELELALQDRHVDVVVLDDALDDLPCAEVLRRITSHRADARVLLWSSVLSAAEATRLVRLGARGFLRKDSPAATLLQGIRVLGDGRRFLPEELSRRLMEPDQSSADAPHELLSHREGVVLHLLARGLSPSEVGHRLEIAPSTVSTHTRRIKDKLGIDSLAGLIHYTVRHALLDDEVA